MTADFEPKRIGDHFRVKHGYAFKGEYFSDAGDYILLTPGNFEPHGGLKLRGDKEKYYTGVVPADFLLEQGDLLVAMTDLTQNAPILGAPAFVSAGRRFLHNQRLGKIVDISDRELDTRYLYYLFNLPSVREQIKATATGATVRHTAPDRIYAVRAPMPPLRVQRRIAAVLGSYDDLIQNNARRIRIIEEMARSLYRECFGGVRFPGEKAAGVPSGWRHGHLGDVVTLQRGFDLPERDRRDGRVPVVSSAGITGTHDTARVTPPGVVTGRYGTLGDVYLIAEPFWPLNTTLFVKDFKDSDPHWVYFLLGDQNFARQNAAGAVPGVNRNALHLLPIVIPPVDTQRRFGTRTLPMLRQIERLRRHSAVLQRARDLLLPRLISGEIELSS